MPNDREVQVHLLPTLVSPECLKGGVAIVVDVLRASTTVVYALAAGCLCIRPCAEVEEARELAGQMRAGRVVLAGERGGKPLPGFDLGNSPREFTAKLCKCSTVVLTTTNGTRALLRALDAERILIACFLNYSAICEQLKNETRPIHIICAGTDGAIALEDTLLAGAFVDFMCEHFELHLNDSARLAWDCFEHHGQVLPGALELGQGGITLKQLGYDEDIRVAAQVDLFNLVPEVRRDPLRIEVGSVGIVANHWHK